MSEAKADKWTTIEAHGALGSDKDWANPVRVTEFDVDARPMFDGRKAHEYLDTPEVLREKAKELAKLIKGCKAVVAYTGAGISTAAGIADYASKAKDASVVEKPEVKDWYDAKPTYAHYALVELVKRDLLHHWIQQNHDGLPQKAGLPQHLINEIHGSLYDPANPIVPIEGKLRDDLFDWLLDWEEKSDLCLALGTSLSGMNADRVARSTAERCLKKKKGKGLVIVSIQKTAYDEFASLRIFAKIDDLMKLLAEELGLTVDATKLYVPDIPAEAKTDDPDVFSIPFAKSGFPALKSRITWDLRVGKKIKLTGGVYKDDIGVITEKTAAGNYKIRFADSIHPVFKVARRPFILVLAPWWIEAAAKGHTIVPGGKIPFVNVD